MSEALPLEYERILALAVSLLTDSEHSCLPLLVHGGSVQPLQPSGNRDNARDTTAFEAAPSGTHAYVVERSDRGFEIFSAGEWSAHTFVDNRETWTHPLAFRPLEEPFRLLPTTRGRRSPLAAC